MTTLPTRTVVSVFAVLALGACTTRAIRAGLDESATTPASVQPLSIRFTNDDRERVHVYLVGERREWLLGRVEPGMTVWLALPRQSLTTDSRSLQIAVLAGAPPSLQAARDSRAIVTMAQPASALLQRQWSFAQGRIVSLLPGM